MGGLAIIGASDRTIWAEWLTRTLDGFGYPAPIWLVNPKYEQVVGRDCWPSLDALPEVPDIGVLVIGAEQALVQCEKLLELGTKEVVVIANGFGETGLPEGREREARLRALCAGSDARVIGPNCIGFARFHERICAIAQPVPSGVRAGDVSIISQSGGLSGGVIGALHGEGLGIDLCYSIGNGVAFSFEDALDWALSRATTRTVCGVVESIRERERVEAAAERAKAAGKDLILLLLGTSREGRSAALSHTGAVIGEQQVLRAYLKKLGVLVAEDVAQQARIAALARVMGRPDPAQGAFVITASGGGAALTADAAGRHGVPLARISSETAEQLREMIPPGPYIGNPLDVTAGNGPGGVQPVYDVVCAEPTVGMLVEPYVLPWPTDDPGNRWHRDALVRVVESASVRNLPLIVVSVFQQELSAWARAFTAQPRVCLTSGLETTMSALGKLYGSSVPARVGQATGLRSGSDSSTNVPGDLLGEAEGRALLAAAGFRLPDGGIARSAEEAVALAGRLSAPVVVKLGVAGVGHKGRVGGVRVGVVGEQAVREAYQAVADAARRHGLGAEDDVPVLVAEMVFGPELLVGAIRDRVAGPSLTVAIGGWAAESARSFGTLSLPLDGVGSRAQLEQWGLVTLLGEQRAVALAGLLDRLAAEFTSGSLAGFATVEVNPVIVTADAAVVADVLLIR